GREHRRAGQLSGGRRVARAYVRCRKIRSTFPLTKHTIRRRKCPLFAPSVYCAHDPAGVPRILTMSVRDIPSVRPRDLQMSGSWVSWMTASLTPTPKHPGGTCPAMIDSML